MLTTFTFRDTALSLVVCSLQPVHLELSLSSMEKEAGCLWSGNLRACFYAGAGGSMQHAVHVQVKEPLTRLNLFLERHIGSVVIVAVFEGS